MRGARARIMESRGAGESANPYPGGPSPPRSFLVSRLAVDKAGLVGVVPGAGVVPLFAVDGVP